MVLFPWEEEEVGYEISSSHFNLAHNLLWFSYRCPKMRNLTCMVLVLRMKHNVNCLIETGCLIEQMHFIFCTLSYCSHAAWENKGIVPWNCAQ